MRNYDKVHHTIFVKDKLSAHFWSDLVYIKDIPHVVLVWGTDKDGHDFPQFSAPLDASKLHLLPGSKVKYLYEFPVELQDKDYEMLRPFLGLPQDK